MIINTTNEMAQFCGGARMVHVEGCNNFLFPWFKAMGSEPVTESVCFLVSPFTFEGIDSKVVVT